MSGIRPVLRLGEVLTSCVVRSAEGIESFQPERAYDVDIEIVFWQEYGNLFSPEAPVRLYDGSRLIATCEYLPLLKTDVAAGGASPNRSPVSAKQPSIT
ncbi:hypothetical protein SLAV_01845 [Streptomyces lavendulae subsp. lavendulae]|uniref:Uncharacterized protein n=1 Tax=Streptomyces lavendulae subsp. lavendulae TaxID=58340 RepID=A0A2K8P962_STRLA|nr:hypothetical protein [Streptomyces lavendulae]ATZ22293.1 hypothetical protein SLAV_01845 [Streptomyces lavendulae subsp. lavendulae]